MCTDISEDGLAAELPKPLAVKTQVTMRMLLPGGIRPLQLEGQVEYSQDRRCGLDFPLFVGGRAEAGPDVHPIHLLVLTTLSLQASYRLRIGVRVRGALGTGTGASSSSLTTYCTISEMRRFEGSSGLAGTRSF